MMHIFQPESRAFAESNALLPAPFNSASATAPRRIGDMVRELAFCHPQKTRGRAWLLLWRISGRKSGEASLPGRAN